jgi:hypothetical protein
MNYKLTLITRNDSIANGKVFGFPSNILRAPSFWMHCLHSTHFLTVRIESVVRRLSLRTTSLFLVVTSSGTLLSQIHCSALSLELWASHYAPSINTTHSEHTALRYGTSVLCTQRQLTQQQIVYLYFSFV